MSVEDTLSYRAVRRARLSLQAWRIRQPPPACSDLFQPGAAVNAAELSTRRLMKYIIPRVSSVDATRT